jgi:O-antigen chain-terminating methyltransferase
VALQEQICAQNTHIEKLQFEIGKLQFELAEVSDRHLALYEAIRLREQREGKSPDDQALMDKWYEDLQELHRGSEESLLSVQHSYVHHFNERAKELRLAGPILDLGCGRGEWLSLMSQEGWAVRGVDSSEQAVSEARGKGVDVELGDLVEVLMACPENSLAGATAFQVIEHLPFPRITALMHAAFRALVPGGILLLETPNPENLQVSSYGFWMDPTHRHPIPPPLIMDLSFHVGFRDGSILRQNPWPQWQEGETESALEREVGFRLFGPQDYALLVFKPTLAD